MKISKALKTKRTILANMIILNAKAEEPPQNDVETKDTNGDNQTPNAPVVNFEDLIANARKQEKEKLYPQIKKLEEANKILTEKNNNHLLTIGEKDSRIKELENQIKNMENSNSKSASEKEEALAKEIESLKQTIANLESNTIDVEELEAQIRGEYEVKLYREQKLREVGDTVIPELITGNTKEEIDQSLEVSKQRFAQLTERILGNVNVPMSNVSTSTFHVKDLKIEDIANIDPRSPEYAELRAKLGLK